jgi:hypothetical protein
VPAGNSVAGTNGDGVCGFLVDSQGGQLFGHRALLEGVVVSLPSWDASGQTISRDCNFVSAISGRPVEVWHTTFHVVAQVRQTTISPSL